MTNGQTVLYVDDEEINRLIFKKKMEKKYKVITAEDGEEGLRVLQSEPLISHIISDMRMPTMTGLEFIDKAKKLYPLKKYYLLTGYAIDEEIQQALDSHLIIHYWVKPADYEAIDKALQAP